MAQGQRALGLLRLGLCPPAVCRMDEQAARPSSWGHGTRPCGPEPPSALSKQMCRQGKTVLLAVPAAARAAGSGHTFLHTRRHPAARPRPLLVHSPGCDTHSSLCVSFRAASGPLVSSHCSSGGGGAVDPLVCWDPLVHALQVSGRRFGVLRPCCAVWWVGIERVLQLLLPFSECRGCSRLV